MLLTFIIPTGHFHFIVSILNFCCHLCFWLIRLVLSVQGSAVNQLKSDMEKLQEEIRANLVSIYSLMALPLLSYSMLLNTRVSFSIISEITLLHKQHHDHTASESHTFWGHLHCIFYC